MRLGARLGFGPSQSTLRTYETSTATISTLSSRRLRQRQEPPQPGKSKIKGRGRLREEEEEEDEEMEVTTSVSLVSRRREARHGVKISIRQTHGYGGVFLSIPHLLIHNVLPASAPVFSIVREGRLDEFKALLQEGKASLRDHDEYGGSLLFVSVCFSIALHTEQLTE